MSINLSDKCFPTLYRKGDLLVVLDTMLTDPDWWKGYVEQEDSAEAMQPHLHQQQHPYPKKIIGIFPSNYVEDLQAIDKTFASTFATADSSPLSNSESPPQNLLRDKETHNLASQFGGEDSNICVYAELDTEKEGGSYFASLLHSTLEATAGDTYDLSREGHPKVCTVKKVLLIVTDRPL